MSPFRNALFVQKIPRKSRLHHPTTVNKETQFKELNQSITFLNLSLEPIPSSYTQFLNCTAGLIVQFSELHKVTLSMAFGLCIQEARNSKSSYATW
jgi:hypothetical protein